MQCAFSTFVAMLQMCCWAQKGKMHAASETLENARARVRLYLLLIYFNLIYSHPTRRLLLQQ
jgi:hypothetical protein